MLIKIPFRGLGFYWLNPDYIAEVRLIADENGEYSLIIMAGGDTSETDLKPEAIAQLCYEASAPVIAHQLARDV